MKMLLTLIVPPSHDEALIDWLLLHPDIEGFTTHTADGHGSHHGLSIAEQVSGRRRQVVFWVELEQDVVDTVLQQLQQAFSGGGLHYWLMPLTAQGVLT